MSRNFLTHPKIGGEMVPVLSGGGKKITVGGTAPTNAQGSNGDVWIPDTAGASLKAKVAGAWVDVGGSGGNSDATGVYATYVGDGAATSIVVTHNLGTQDVVVATYEKASPYAEIEPIVERTSINSVTLKFDIAPTIDEYRVVVTKGGGSAGGTAVNGVPTGGTTGQVLGKTTNADYDVAWMAASSGTGDVAGPASSTDNAIARFDTTTGKLLQNSTATISDAGTLTLPDSANLSINAATSFGTGAGVLGFKNATTAPTTNPADGVVAYAESGVLKVRQADGGVVTLSAQSFDAKVTTLTSTAIQAAIDAAETAGGGTVLLGAGTFIISASVRMKTGVHLRGAGEGATILYAADNLNAHVLRNDDFTNGNTDWSVSDLTVDGNRTNQSLVNMYGINTEHCSRYNFTRVTVRNARGIGFYLLGAAGGEDNSGTWRYLRLTDITVHGCGSTGIHVGNAMRAVTYQGVTAYNNNGYGISVDHSESACVNLHAYQNSLSGIYIRNVYDVTLSNLHATRNGQHGILVVAFNDGTGSNWQAFENGTSGAGYNDVHFSGDGLPTWGYGVTGGVVVDGIRCGKLLADTRNWKPTIATTATPEDYGLYVADELATRQVHILNVNASTGSLGRMRLPATRGTLVVSSSRVNMLDRQVKVKSVDESVTSSTTLQADDDLTFPAEANDRWFFEFDLNVQVTGGDTADFQAGVVGPAGSTGWFSVVGPGAAHSGTGASTLRTNIAAFGSSTMTVGIPGTTAGAGALVRITGTVLVGSTAGLVTLSWAQGVSSTDPTIVKAGSLLRAERVL